MAPNTPSRGPICDPAKTGMCGSTYNLTLSHDPGQQYIVVADGTNHRIWIHDRHTEELKGSVGSPGRMARPFFWIDAIATDSVGNIYTGEVWTGKRVQKFILKNGDGVRRMCRGDNGGEPSRLGPVPRFSAAVTLRRNRRQAD